MLVDTWILLGLPLSGLALGGVGYLWLRHNARAFERRYGGHATPGE